jgi:two-component system, LuxR family, sensor kinase FixL
LGRVTGRRSTGDERMYVRNVFRAFREAFRTIPDERLASVLDTAAEGIVIIDEQARMLIFNKACENMFGYKASQVIGKDVSILMPAEEAAHHDGYIQAYLRTGHHKIIGIGREVRGKRRDGTLFSVDISVGEAVTPEGRQFIGILRDLTARKDAERRISELQTSLIRLARLSAIDEMGCALAHELNQPLTALTLYLQAAERELRRAQERGHNEQTDQQQYEIIKKAEREAKRASAIVQRVRQLVETRKPQCRPVDFNAIVADALELSLIGQDGALRVIRHFRADLPLIEADQVQIQQVVVNLVRNACEAVRGREDAQITVSTSRDDRHIMLSVEDNGPGIPPDQMPDLFQVFKTGKRGGMGLGLAISRTIVQSHGGELLVEPGGNGRGASFMVRLPIRYEMASQPVLSLSNR